MISILYEQCTETVLAGITLCFFTVYLLEYPYCLLMTLSYLIDRDSFVFKLDYIDIVKALAAAECVFLDILGIHAYFKIHKVLTAVKRPIADTLYGSRYNDGLQ